MKHISVFEKNIVHHAYEDFRHLIDCGIPYSNQNQIIHRAWIS